MRKILRTSLLSVLLFLCMMPYVFAQDIQVTGTIVDEQDVVLPGVSVSVKGSQIGTFTDLNGKYSIKTSSSAILVITYLGMEKQEVNISGRTNINIVLKSSARQLDDVVVVGYGLAKRSDLTTAQTSISSKEMDRTINTTIEQAIQGRSAGVYITQNSGQPGGGISVNIRGVNSINGTNEPLYVIDGVQIQGESVEFGAQSSSNPLAGLNPSDIEDIQVLQGPSATAIYGSRATNGVLIITTKRGKAGDVKISYGLQHNLQEAPKKLQVMNLRQYAQMVGEYHDILGGETPLEFLDPSLLGIGTDWQKELFRTTPMTKHQLSLGGGNEKTTYYLSADYLKQEGIAVGSGFDRYSFRLNLDNKPRNWMTLGANLSFNQTNENLITSNENIISNSIRLTPQVPVKNFDGTWGGGDLTNGANIFAPVNPIAIANLRTNELTRRQFLGGINLGIKIIEGLDIRTSLNTNVSYSNALNYLPVYKIGWAENVTATLSTGGSGLSTYWNWNQLIEYKKKIGKHDFSLMASHEAQASNWKNVGASRNGFLTDDIMDLNAGDVLTASNSGGSGDWALESYIGRLNYNFNDRYLFTGTVRRDGSVNFGPDNKWGFFPSASAAWRVSQEDFFNLPFISDLKLRFETGLTGNQGSGGIYSPMQAGATPTGTGFLPARYGNPELKWEETLTNNIGLNIAFLNNRIQLEADYYIKNTDNLLMENPLPWYMGTNGQGAVGAPMVNIGSLKNKGWGISINTVNIDKKQFKWQSNLNLSRFKTNIEKFYSESAFIERTSWWLDNWTQRSSVGLAPWLFRGYIEEGLFQSIEEINNSAVPVDNNGVRYPTQDVNGIWVGDVKFKDLSGPDGTPDGKIDIYDQTYIGNPWPKLFGGFTNNFSYKGFDLSVLITGTFGNDVYNYLAKRNSNPNNINLSQNLLVEALDYAKPITNDLGDFVLANPQTIIPRLSHGPNDNHARATSRWVEDGSFLRVKNVSLTYHIPAAFLSKQKLVRGAKATFGVQNIATITGYSGYDPEVGSYVGRDASATNQAIGLDFGRYPLTPIYSFSIGFDF
jgi:TonB-linked SusC/RagA family outer membrane protein